MLGVRPICMRLLKISVFVLATFLALGSAAWYGAKSRTFQVFGELTWRVETNRRLVALTFDDGPHPAGVSRLLPMLRQNGVRATFFVTGAELERRPWVGAQLVDEGHELGNHSYSHARMVFKSQAFIASEVDRTDALIRSAGQTGAINFRPPYGVKGIGLPYYLARTGRRTIMWDLEPDSDTAIASSSEAIAAHVIERAGPGSIVLLHVMYPRRRPSLEAVPAIIEGLRSKGFEFVTVSELLDASSDE